MRLRRVELRNFRSHREDVLDLLGADGEPVGALALIGPNGSGKTAWLDALSGFFTHLVGDYRGRLLDGGDVREGADALSVRVVWDDDLDGQREVFEAHLEIVLDPSRAPGVFESWSEPPGVSRWRSHVSAAVRRSSGVIVYFDALRFLPPVEVAGPNKAKVTPHRVNAALAPSVVREEATWWRFGHLRQWIVNLEFERLRAKERGEALPAWDHLVRALDVLLAPCRVERVSDAFEVMVRTPSGVVPIQRLSSGYQSILVVASELLLRLELAVSSPSKVFEVEAVCMIDEVDAHLHPQAQERLIDGLRGMFPRVQFVMTTHSPMVAGCLRADEIRELKEAP